MIGPKKLRLLTSNEKKALTIVVWSHTRAPVVDLLKAEANSCLMVAPVTETFVAHFS